MHKIVIKATVQSFSKSGYGVRDPYDWSVWINDLFVTRADGKRSEYFELVRPGIPYYGPIHDQERKAAKLRRAA